MLPRRVSVFLSPVFGSVQLSILRWFMLVVLSLVLVSEILKQRLLHIDPVSSLLQPTLTIGQSGSVFNWMKTVFRLG